MRRVRGLEDSEYGPAPSEEPPPSPFARRETPPDRDQRFAPRGFGPADPRGAPPARDARFRFHGVGPAEPDAPPARDSRFPYRGLNPGAPRDGPPARGERFPHSAFSPGSRRGGPPARDDRERRRPRRPRRAPSDWADEGDGPRRGRRRRRDADEGAAVDEDDEDEEDEQDGDDGEDAEYAAEDERLYQAERQQRLETPRPYAPEGFGDADLEAYGPAFPVGDAGARHFGAAALRRLVEPLQTGHGVPLYLRREVLAADPTPHDLPFGAEQLSKSIADHEAQLARPGLYEPTKRRLTQELEEMKRQLPIAERVDNPLELAKHVAVTEAAAREPGLSDDARRGLRTEVEDMKRRLRSVEQGKAEFRSVLAGRYRSALDGDSPVVAETLRVAHRNASYSVQDEMALKKKIGSLLAAPRGPPARNVAT